MASPTQITDTSVGSCVSPLSTEIAQRENQTNQLNDWRRQQVNNGHVRRRSGILQMKIVTPFKQHCYRFLRLTRFSPSPFPQYGNRSIGAGRFWGVRSGLNYFIACFI